MVGDVNIGEDGAGLRESFLHADFANMLGCRLSVVGGSSRSRVGSGCIVMSDCTLFGVGKCPLVCSGTLSPDSSCDTFIPSLVESFTPGEYTDGCLSPAGSSGSFLTVLSARTRSFVCSCGIESIEFFCSSCDAVSPFVVGTVELGEWIRLVFRLFRAAGAGFTANSWAPGVGGGRKDDEGDGNGDDDASPSRDIDSLDAVGYSFSIRLPHKCCLWKQ